MTEPVAVEETRPHDIPWYAIAEWSLRRKLALALAIPVLLAATFGGLRVVSATSEAQSFSRLESRVTVLQPAVRLIDSASAMAVAGRSTDEAAIERTRATFDAAAAQLRKVMRTSELTDEQMTSLDQALASAQTVRSSPATAAADTVATQFAQTSGFVTTALTQLTAETSDTRLTTVRDVLAGQVALTRQRLLAATPTATSPINPISLGNAIGEEATAIAALESTLGANDTFVSALSAGNELRLAAAPNVAAGTAALPRAQDAVSVYTTLAKQVTDQVVASMRERASDERLAAIRDAVTTIVLLVAAVALALLVARMLLEPLKRVRLGALDVAQEQLPTALKRIRDGEEPAPVQPLPVHTSEEVGQLARAVDVLHGEAIQLATQQARLREQVSAMFETLSRRSTSLINQQLGLIETLERDEDDPRRLESLFRLDHLAARIRRNGESLLVLAGAAPRGGDGQDLPLGDVVRAAVSEVQDYQRVRLSVSDLSIRAAAAPNLVHLFAELIDNALSYSPPDSTVTVASVRGVDGGTLVEVTDDGLGMTPEAVASANDALDTGGEVTTETARRMGLYVVGQLAIRHEVTVRIRPNPESTGTIVSVFLPAALLASGRGGTSAGPARAAGTGTGSAPAAARDLTGVRGLTPTLDSRAQTGPLSTSASMSAMSTATPTTLPNMSVLRPESPVQSDQDGRGEQGDEGGQAGQSTSTPSGLPRRRPASTPPRPAWAGTPAGTAPGAQAPASATPPADPNPSAAPVVHPAPSAPDARSATAAPAAAPAAAAAPGSTSIRDLAPAPVAGTPIFRQLQTSWLSDSSGGDLPWASAAIDEGWQAAARASSGESAGRSASGLPVRRPGSTLVPGQAGPGGATPVLRDPEAIRAHLNRHLAGVRRGRAGTTNDDTRSGHAGATLLDEENDRP